MKRSSRSAKRSTIELTDDMHQDEPAAWMVFLYDTTMREYLVFVDKGDAERCASEQADEADRDWLIYPLYATHGEYV
jgi:hypothetical protein